MTRIDYDDRLHRSYHEARRLLPQTAKLWMDVARQYVGARRGLTILDLGSGTGRFSPLLADTFDARVIGVEPADKMRAAAQKESRHPNVRYVKGAAERIPLEDASCDVAWLSMIAHHISDLRGAARELHRVLKPDGLVFIRNCYKGRLDSIRIYEFFPSAMAIDNARLPSVEAVRSAFEGNKFRFVDSKTIEQTLDLSLAENVERIRKRGWSTSELISDEDFERGIQLMEQAARKEDPPRPVTELIDLLVLRRPGEEQ